MSKFTQSVTKDFEFDGDTVSVKMNRIKRADMMKVAPLIPQGRMPDQNDSLAILDMACGFCESYVVEFRGLKDDEGNAIAFDVVLSEAYFQELLSEIIAWWFDASQMSREEVGKRKPQRRGGGAG